MMLNSRQQLPTPAFEDLHHIHDNDVRKETPSHFVLTYLPTYVFQ